MLRRATRSLDGGAGHPIKLADVVAEEAERHPGATVETFATDEHRIGLKPILRRVWAPKGQRPIARGHHRFEWFYVTAFVSPATGESFWYLSTGVSKALFEGALALFAREARAGQDRITVLDGAGHHTLPLAVPEGALADHPRERVITLLAVGVSHLRRQPALQLELSLGLPDERRRPGTRQGMARWSADRAMDAIRERFGRDAIGYATTALGWRRSVPDAFRELAEKDPEEQNN